MTNDNLDRSIRAIVGDARPTPEAEAAMDDAFAAIAQEAAARSPAPSTSRRRPAPVLVPRWARAAAVACAVCLGVGGTAYAADALGLINLQQSGDYQTLMAVDAGEVAAPATGPVADYRLEFANLPEGAAAFDRDNHLAKYDWADHEKGFSAFLFYLDSSEPLPVSFTTGATPVSVNGAEGVVFEKPGIAQGDHSLDMYLVFPDEQRVLWLWTDSLTSDELTRIAEAACLIPTGTKVIPGSDGTLRAWSEEIAQARGAGEETETAEFKLDASAEEMSALHAVAATPGEAATVQLAWIVPADELDKLLLNLSGDGTYASFDESDLALGYVDMRQ